LYVCPSIKLEVKKFQKIFSISRFSFDQPDQAASSSNQPSNQISFENPDGHWPGGSFGTEKPIFDSETEYDDSEENYLIYEGNPERL
jgi:hypothetical protein